LGTTEQRSQLGVSLVFGFGLLCQCHNTASPPVTSRTQNFLFFGREFSFSLKPDMSWQTKKTFVLTLADYEWREAAPGLSPSACRTLQVVRSNRQARKCPAKSKGTPAMDL